MKSIEILENRLANLKDGYQHYTMVDKDKNKAFWIKNDIEEVELLLKDLYMLKELTQYSSLSEIKKEWEEKGFTWIEKCDYHNGHDYRCYFLSKKTNQFYNIRFIFYNYKNTYCAYEGYDSTDKEGYPVTKYKPLNLDLEMQNLITRTLLAVRDK